MVFVLKQRHICAIAGLHGKLRALAASKVARIEGVAFEAFQDVRISWTLIIPDNVINSLKWWLWAQQKTMPRCVFEMHFFSPPNRNAIIPNNRFKSLDLLCWGILGPIGTPPCSKREIGSHNSTNCHRKLYFARHSARLDRLLYAMSYLI